MRKVLKKCALTLLCASLFSSSFTFGFESNAYDDETEILLEEYSEDISEDFPDETTEEIILEEPDESEEVNIEETLEVTDDDRASEADSAELSADAPATSGKIKDISWSYDTNTKVLKISGKGEIPDCKGDAPWAPFAEEALEISVSGNITKIGDYAFLSFTKVKKIQLPDTVKTLGRMVFYRLGDSYTKKRITVHLNFPSLWSISPWVLFIM